VLIGPGLIAAGVAATAIGFAFGLNALPPAVEAVPQTIAIASAAPPINFDAYFDAEAFRPTPVEAPAAPSGGYQLASLESETVVLPPMADPKPELTTSSVQRKSKAKAGDTAMNIHVASFDERFSGEIDWPISRQAAVPPQRAEMELAYAPSAAEHSVVRRAAPVHAALPPAPPVTAAKKPVQVAALVQDDSGATTSTESDADVHTAIYDISAHTVYLPNGRRLEAHSGLGSFIDNPRYVSERDRGPTPPNVYDLSLREELFHGVRALRLTPVGNGKMYGRDGILAHTYMLGANGQSNGCVSFNDYQAFLHAYLNGEVTRMVVVDHLASAPSPRTAAGWLPEKLRELFGHS